VLYSCEQYRWSDSEFHVIGVRLPMPDDLKVVRWYQQLMMSNRRCRCSLCLEVLKVPEHSTVKDTEEHISVAICWHSWCHSKISVICMFMKNLMSIAYYCHHVVVLIVAILQTVSKLCWLLFILYISLSEYVIFMPSSLSSFTSSI